MAFIIYLSFRIFYYGHFAMVQNKPQNEIMFMRNCNGLKVKLLSPCWTEFFSQMKVVRPITNTRWWDTFNGSRISLKEKVFSTSYYLRARAYSMYYLLLSSLLLYTPFFPMIALEGRGKPYFIFSLQKACFFLLCNVTSTFLFLDIFSCFVILASFK